MRTADGKDRRVSNPERVKTCAAWMLLSLPLVVYPLFWVRVFRSRLVAWDRVTLITLPVLAVFAAAVLLLTGVSRLRRKCAVSGLNMLLVLFAAALLVLSLAWNSIWTWTRSRWLKRPERPSRE